MADNDEWLIKKGASQRAQLRGWKVSIVPVVNSDGVAAGCTRLTGPTGIDLNIEALQKRDATAGVTKRWLADRKPGDPERQALDRLCRRQYGTLGYILEFPWHGSSFASMKRSGVHGFRAALKAHAASPKDRC